MNHWRPLTQKPEPGLVWVKYIPTHNNPTNEEFSSVAYYEHDEFIFVQPATEHARYDNYTFDFIGKVTGWLPLRTPSVEHSKIEYCSNGEREPCNCDMH